MDEPTLQSINSAPIAAPDGTTPIPTLENLAIDTSWQTVSPAAQPTAEPPKPPTEPAIVEEPTGSQRLVPGWLRRIADERRLRDSVTELGTTETEAIERAPDSPALTIIKTLLSFLGSAALAYLILTFPSQAARAAYVISHLTASSSPAKIVQENVTSGSFAQVVTPSLSFNPPALPTSQPAASPPTNNSPFSDLADNQLYLPKIDVRTPIVWDSSFEEKAMLANLQKGVVHYGGTDFPATDKGNVFITGHSSYYWWDSGKYKTVFANLDKLATGDQSALTYQGKVYVYQVYEKIVVKPSETSVLDTTPKPILTLMTCTPVGTSLNRLIVKSNLVGVFEEGATSANTPSAPANTSSTPAAPTQSVPATAPNDSLSLIPALH